MYSQTMAARFDCKKLLRFALATLCLLALAMFMPVAARAEGDPTETKSWTCQKDGTTYLDVARNGGTTQDHNVGTATLKVHVWKPNGTFIEPEVKDFKYHYNNHKDDDLSVKFNTNYASDDTIAKAFSELNDKGGKGDGGYGSVDLILTAADGYKIYAVEYTVCHSSGGPSNTGWRDDTNTNTKVEDGIPTQTYYLDNVTDGTTVDIYLMQEYTVQYQVRYNNQPVQNPGDYLEGYTTNLLAEAKAYPNDPAATVRACEFLEDKDLTKEKLEKKEGLYGYHRWCDRENEPKAVDLAVSRFKDGYKVATTVTVPTLNAKEGYTVSVSGWTVGENNTVKFGDTVKMSDLAQYADENRVITLTAVVKDNTPNTDNSGNGGTTGGDSGDSGSTGGDSGNTGSGDGSTNGGQESTTTPAPETTPAPTPSVTTVTAVAPTATPTATPAPTAEPTATPAPAAVSAHIPQTSDDMPYTLLVVTALASLCAAGALFMKRRSK